MVTSDSIKVVRFSKTWDRTRFCFGCYGAPTKTAENIIFLRSLVGKTQNCDPPPVVILLDVHSALIRSLRLRRSRYFIPAPYLPNNKWPKNQHTKQPRLNEYPVVNNQPDTQVIQQQIYVDVALIDGVEYQIDVFHYS